MGIKSSILSKILTTGRLHSNEGKQAIGRWCQKINASEINAQKKNKSEYWHRKKKKEYWHREWEVELLWISWLEECHLRRWHGLEIFSELETPAMGGSLEGYCGQGTYQEQRPWDRNELWGTARAVWIVELSTFPFKTFQFLPYIFWCSFVRYRYI